MICLNIKSKLALQVIVSLKTQAYPETTLDEEEGRTEELPILD